MKPVLKEQEKLELKKTAVKIYVPDNKNIQIIYQ